MSQTRLTQVISGVVLLLSVGVALGVADYVMENMPKMPTETVKSNNSNDASLTFDSIKNAEYTFGSDGIIKLKNGSYDIEYPGSASVGHFGIFDNKISLGDLSGDGKNEAAVILDNYGGGSGHFYKLAVVVNRNGKTVHIASEDLGDRTKINSLAIKDGKIIVDMITQGPDDAMCCPTLRKIIEYKLINEKLVKTGESEVNAGKATGLKSFKIDNYGISFDYPASWGDYGNYTKEKMESFEKDRGITYYFDNNPDIHAVLESKNFKIEQPGGLYNYVLDGVNISFENVADTDKYCDKNESESLSCRKYDLKSGNGGIIEDRSFCSASPTGGGVSCFYKRYFFITTGNKDYPVFILSMTVRGSNYSDLVYRTCDYEYTQDLNLTKNCFRKNYKIYFDSYEKDLGEFDSILLTFKFIDGTQPEGMATNYCSGKRPQHSYDNYIGYDKIFLLNFDSDKDKEIAGVCSTGGNGDKEGLLFVLGSDNGQYNPVLEQEGQMQHQRFYDFQNLQKVDVDKDGINEIMYEGMAWSNMGGDHWLKLYSPKYKEWFILTKRWSLDESDLASGKRIEKTDFSPNLKNSKYQVFKNFLIKQKFTL